MLDMKKLLLIVVLLLAPFLSAQGKIPVKSAAKRTAEVRCRQALHEGTGTMRAFVDGDGMQALVPAYSDGKIDVYINQKAWDFEMADSPFPGFNGNFIGYLFFVFRDEAMRQQAIALLRSHYAPPRQGTCRQLAARQPTPKHPINGVASGEIWENVSCPVHPETFENFKYVVMSVYYRKGGIAVTLPRRPPGAPRQRDNKSVLSIPGPLLELGVATNVINSASGFSKYVAPLECAKPNAFGVQYNVRIEPGFETICTMGTTIGTSVLADDNVFNKEAKTPMFTGSVPAWDLLLGDLGPLEEPQAGPHVFRINSPQAAFVYRALESTLDKMKSNWTKLHPDAENCSYWHARASNTQLEMSYPDVWARCKGQLLGAKP